jgi:hypothetical protein
LHSSSNTFGKIKAKTLILAGYESGMERNKKYVDNFVPKLVKEEDGINIKINFSEI